MLSISSAMHGGGMAKYLLNEDYWATEAQSLYMGEGAKALKLHGHVNGREFRNLMKGVSPDGKTPLVQNPNAPKRQSLWDLTWSVPKSVSVLWSQSPAEIRQKIEVSLMAAVSEVINHMERAVVQTRRGHGGARLEPVKLVVAAFLHGTSREKDPQVHVHTCLLNVGLRLDRTFGSISTWEVFQQKLLLGALFRLELATRL